MFTKSKQMHILTFHFALFQFGGSLGGSFIGAYLMECGFSLNLALTAYSVYFLLRLCLRFLSLELIRCLGYRRAMVLGTLVIALQFVALTHADRPVWFGVWLACMAFGESLYWPIYHALTAVLGHAGSRGRQLGLRTVVSTAVTVVGPLAGGWLLTRCGPATDFAAATVLTLLASIPLVFLRMADAGSIPSPREALRGADRLSMLAFVADGWLASGLYIAWPMILFSALGSQFAVLGASNAAAGLVGAAVGYLCGHGIDRGQGNTYLRLVCMMLLAGFLLRGVATWSPCAALAANLTGAAVGAMYSLVLMSTIYDRAKRSGATFRFHFAAEAGWDLGVMSGTLMAAGVALLSRDAPSLVILPAALGIALIYRCARCEDDSMASYGRRLGVEALAT